MKKFYLSLIIAMYIFSSTVLFSQSTVLVDSLNTYNFEEAIEVNAIRDSSRIIDTKKTINDNLHQCMGIEFIERASFSKEIIYRGLSGSRLDIKIDGMKMMAACTDKMDPINIYLESENISDIQVNSEKGSNNIDFVNFSFSEMPYQNDFGFALKTEYATNSNALNTALNGYYSNENTSFLSSLVHKNASNYFAANNTEIRNSGYSKNNFRINFKHKISDNYESSFNFLFDESGFAGYPALIMDAEYAKALMISSDNKYKDISNFIAETNLKLYFNSVKHLMSDYRRSLEEIKSRQIMSSMYMPMQGNTSTYGAILNNKLLIADHTYFFDLEFSNSNMFADMKMIALDSTVAIMYLKNIGNSSEMNIRASINSDYKLSEYRKMSYSVGIDLQKAQLYDEDAKRALLIYFPSKSLSDFNQKSKVQLFANLAFNQIIDDMSLIKFSLSFSQRAMNINDLYSYFLYNPSDNSIYIGNPFLDKENAIKSEISYINNLSDNWDIEVNVYAYYYPDFLASRIIQNADTSNKLFPQAVKLIDFVGETIITGLEGRIRYKNSDFSSELKVNYNHTEAVEIDDPLPLQLPLSVQFRAGISLFSGTLSTVIMGDLAQNRYSTVLSNEKNTPAFVTMDLQYANILSSYFEYQIKISNLFDTYYFRHNTISALAHQGRSFNFLLQFKI